MPRGRPGITPKIQKERVNQTEDKPKLIRNSEGGGGLPGAGPGRPKGSRNKFSGDLKRAILDALANAHPNDGDATDYLIGQAQQPNPSPFMSLIGKCITQESTVQATVMTHFTWGAVMENEDRRKGETENAV